MSNAKVNNAAKIANAPDTGPLVFIDTNVFLRFYQFGREAGEGTLDKIAANRGRLILTEQVQMEFMKNRQFRLNELAKLIKSDVNEGSVHPPPLLRTPRSKANKARQTLNALIDKERQRIKEAYRNPERLDPVYRLVNALMKTLSPFKLTREQTEYDQVRAAAHERYLLGYPPRKHNDTSFGDAINWEWVVRCSKQSKRDVIIVTADSDYGYEAGDERHVNDWLAHEFKRRTGRRVSVTSLLSDAFKHTANPLTKEQANAERESAGAADLATLSHNELFEIGMLTGRVQKALYSVTDSNHAENLAAIVAAYLKDRLEPPGAVTLKDKIRSRQNPRKSDASS